MSPRTARRCLICSHPAEYHEHYRTGRECSVCECEEFRSTSSIRCWLGMHDWRAATTRTTGEGFRRCSKCAKTKSL